VSERVSARPTTVSGATTTPPPETTTTTTEPTDLITSDPFTIGVASGDPLPDAVILWTRLVTADALPAEDIPVDSEVATDATSASPFADPATAVNRAGAAHVKCRGDRVSCGA